MELKLQQLEILGKAILKYGHEAQTDMVMEECAELTKAILKHRRSPSAETLAEKIDETADAFIMIMQNAMMVDMDLVQKRIDFKINRLKERINS